MGEKRILIADADSGAWVGFGQTLNQRWTLVTVTNGNAALAEIDREPCDVVIADLDLPEVNGSDLLNRIRQEQPKTVLFILGTDADKERVMKNVLGAHQFLTKPCDHSTLKTAIERALALDVWLASNKLRELVSRVRTFPTVPSLYFEVLAALNSPSATTEQVGAIIAKDMAMMTKLLQVLNSAYFGLARKITSPEEAVGILGFDAVKSMVMTLKLLSQYDNVKPVYFSIDRLWRHSTQVARRSKQLTLLATGDIALAESAFTAGLMHDLGKIILASNFDEQYRGVQSLAAKQQLPLWEVEREIFGAHHGTIGAYLLGLWGMPLDLLEASALHHQPSQSITKGFSALSAVHITNVWEHAARTDKEGFLSPKMDESYLAELGILEQMNPWHDKIYHQKDSGKFTSKTKALPAKTQKIVQPKTISVAVAAATAAPAAKPAPIIPLQPTLPWYAYSRNKRVYTGAAAAAMVVMFFGIMAAFKPNATKKIVEGTPLVVRARTAPEPQTVSVADAKTNAPTVAVAKPAPIAKSSSKEIAFADVKLQGIFFAAHQPSAILNGTLVHPNDRFAGARVLTINSASVVLEYQGKRTTLSLK